MPSKPEVDYERELRLAVVMYGGVSLAIYMNGATQELLQLVRATATDPDDPTRARYTDEELGGSARVYRQLARLGLGDGDQPENMPGPIRQRFVIDILSGTSAGGINAIFLAKALANGQSLEGSAKLWQSEADLGLLINDAESRHQTDNLPANRKPKSLLNSHRMYRKLLDAFDEMDSTPPATSLVDEVDLFVTATDLEGLRLRLQLGGGEVAEERRYRKSFHLSRGGNRNDFERVDNPFLAFIARCTSSLPVAFEPMQVAAATSLLKLSRRELPDEPVTGAAPDSSGIPARWRRHFEEYMGCPHEPVVPADREFTDGGYLDNKPFSYAIDAIIEKRGGDSGLVERKLLYIEPDPERLSLQREEHTEPTSVIDNALAVIRLRSYETIREELLRVRDRNRLIDKIRSVVAGIDADVEALGDPARPEEGAKARGALASIIANRTEFDQRALAKVIGVFGAAYGGYHRLKVGQLTDELAQMVAAHSRISPASDECRAIRLLVRAWRNARYTFDPESKSHQSEFHFLRAFDLSYRIRRASFVIDQINRVGAMSPMELAVELADHPSICGGPTAAALVAEDPLPLAGAFDNLRRGLAGVVRKLRSARQTLLRPDPDALLPVISEYGVSVRKLAADIMAQPTDRQRRQLVDDLVRVGGDLDAMLEEMQAALEARVADAADAARSESWRLLETDGNPQHPGNTPTSPHEVARFIARHYYDWFELYDSMLFPIIHGSEVGEEIATVEPIRISPLTGRDDAGLPIPNARLMPAGVAAGHFGAFLSPEWRARDILIGRMNAAEKLIRTVLAGTTHDRPAVVAGFVERAHRSILEEECARRASIVGRRLAGIQNVTTAEDRLAYLKEEGLPPEELPPVEVVGWIGRLAKVMGRVFREASQQPGIKRVATGVLYGGQLVSGMIEVLVPRKWWWLMVRLWIPRLLVFATTLIVLGFLLRREQVTNLGWIAFGLVVGISTVTFVLRSLLKNGKSWVLRVLTSLVAAAVVVFIAIGIAYAPEAARSFWARIVEWVGR